MSFIHSSMKNSAKLRVGLLYSGIVAGSLFLKNQIEDKFYSSANNSLESSLVYESPEVVLSPRNDAYSVKDLDSFVEDEVSFVEDNRKYDSDVEILKDSSNSDKNLIEMISRHEGLRNFAYDDSLGIRTIGIGFNLERSDAKEKISELGLNFSDVYSGKLEISDSQAYSLMSEDIENSTLDAKKYIGKNFDSLPLDVQHVLIDMSYNLGYTRLSKFKNLRKEIIEGDFKGAAEEMIDSKWYGQVGNRSKELVEIMRNVEFFNN